MAMEGARAQPGSSLEEVSMSQRTGREQLPQEGTEQHDVHDIYETAAVGGRGGRHSCPCHDVKNLNSAEARLSKLVQPMLKVRPTVLHSAIWYMTDGQ